MADSKILISWIIIGRNWADTIKKLVDSLNNQAFDSKRIELIIIDDASSDNSIEHLKDIEFENKKIIKLDKQSGRCVARNTGIKIAEGEYCLFTNSNTIPENNFLEQYINTLSQSTSDGAAGVIQYSCLDTSFEKYLNHDERGLKQHSIGDLLPIQYILFGNCAIKTSLIQNSGGFNEKLTGYGGEEIELLDRIQHKHDLKVLKINAKSLRVNHLDFHSHCARLMDFGSTNFKHLPFNIQKNIIPGSLIKLYMIVPASLGYYILCFIKDRLKLNCFILIKILMGLSILRGYKR